VAQWSASPRLVPLPFVEAEEDLRWKRDAADKKLFRFLSRAENAIIGQSGGEDGRTADRGHVVSSISIGVHV
jgi:hypothetical protein